MCTKSIPGQLEHMFISRIWTTPRTQASRMIQASSETAYPTAKRFRSQTHKHTYVHVTKCMTIRNQRNNENSKSTNNTHPKANVNQPNVKAFPDISTCLSQNQNYKYPCFLCSDFVSDLSRRVFIKRFETLWELVSISRRKMKHWRSKAVITD